MSLNNDPSQAPIPASVLDRYLAGTATAGERARVEQWWRATSLNNQVTSVLRAEAADAQDIAHVWDQIRIRALSAEASNTTEPNLFSHQAALIDTRPSMRRSEGRKEGLGVRPLPIASKIRGVLGPRSLPLGTRPLRAFPMRRVLPPLAFIAAVLAVIAIPTMRRTASLQQSVVTSRVYATHRAQQATVTLDDGSTVTLAPETRIHYTTDRAGVRSVELTGEAFFTVVPHVGRPFVVRTGSVATRVLGTTFDVRRYVGDAATLVTVVNGRVATGSHTTPVVLVAGTMARVTDSSTTVSPVSNPTQVVLWTQGSLVFTEAPVPVVLATLSRWYGYEFHIADTALATKVISGKFRTDQLTETINTLKAVLGVTMSFDGKVVTLRLPRTADTQFRRTSTREFLRNLESEVGK